MIAVTEATVPAARKPLRLWPGVVAAVALFVVRFVLPFAGAGSLMTAIQRGILGAAAVLVWWIFLSRAPWRDRLGAIGVMIAATGASWILKHESMGPFPLVAYGVPILCLAFVASAAAGRRLAERPRRALMAATIVLACGAWTLVRTGGMSTDMVATLSWRWTPSPEERLLAEAAKPTVVPPMEVAPPAPKAEAAVPAATEPAAVLTPTSERAIARVEWFGFRGPQRDSAAPGVRIEANWSQSPPVELWRRPIGPGWSSFAVRGNILYTQEQRGADEIVASYNTNTGRPVWTHRDPVRFVESIGGVGPRATPTLSRGRVYTLGATGILNALDAGDGSVVWSRNVASDTGTEVPYWGFSGSPLVLDDLVVVAVAGRLAGYERATGVPRWSGAAGEGYSSPHLATIGGVAQILLMTGTGTISVAPADGKVLWEHVWKGLPLVQPAVTPDGDLLIVASAGSGIRRIGVANGPGGWTVQERWTSAGLKPYFNDFVVHEGHAYGFDGRILACIDLQTGERKWKGGRYGNGQLVLLPDQDALLVLSEEGELALVAASPSQFTELARVPAIQGKTWNHPVVAGDVLLVRNAEEMAAFRLPLEKR